MKRRTNAAIEERGDGRAWPLPPDALAANEELRLWYVREIVRRDHITWSDMNWEQKRVCPERKSASSDGGPRVPLHEQLAHANDDGTITCTGPCGEAKPAKKFPTARGAIGRLSECRACRDARVAATKAPQG